MPDAPASPHRRRLLGAATVGMLVLVAPLVALGTQDGQDSRVGDARLYFRVADLEAHHRRLEARGVQTTDIIETAWMDMCIARDPDGHEIVFAVTDPERHSIDPW